MKFVFVCPVENGVFESADFSVMEYKGVVLDDAGNKTVDAKVGLDGPCPFCGRKHVYLASELSCPFGGNAKEDE